jgi:hypothetical protein
MQTNNPHRDSENHENQLDKKEQEREMRNKCLLQDADFITNTLTQDEVPGAVIDVVIAQIGRMTVTQDCNAAYRAIGRAVAEWMTEAAWKVSKKK